MKNVELQAHRGVSTDFPENTMAAFQGAVDQGYKIIELDPGETKDCQIVVLHDWSINRTGRNADGQQVEQEIKICDIAYEEALEYEFGSWFAEEFKGEKIPLLADVLKLAKEHNILVKIDNKFQRFSEAGKAELFRVARESGAHVAFTCTNMEAIDMALENVPGTDIHYDGLVTEEMLQAVTAKIPGEKLVVWVPHECKRSAGWITVEFASPKLCGLVKQYATLGIWILSEEEDLEDAILNLGADLIETTGKLKPEMVSRIMGK